MKNIKYKSLAREYTFKFLYHLQLPEFLEMKNSLQDKITVNETIDQYLEEFDLSYLDPDPEHPENIINKNIKDFAKSLILGILKHNTELEDKISKLLKNRTLSTLDRVNLTILYLGAYEILKSKDVPIKVSINEAIRLAKKYGSKNSYSFINGILDNLAKKDESA